MVTKFVDSLIDKQDNSEIIRDQIAAIILLNSQNQQTLATNENKNPDDWKLQVFTEASDPYHKWLNIGDNNSSNSDFDFSSLDQSPIVNVWYQSGGFVESASDTVERQMCEGTFYIDVYGLGFSQSDGNGGQIPSDKAAALEAQRAMRLVRNILMAGVNTYLLLRKTVWKRFPRSIEFFQPQLEQTDVQQIVAGRLSLGVEFNEFAPQITPVDLEEVGIVVKRAEDGSIYFEAEYTGLNN